MEVDLAGAVHLAVAAEEAAGRTGDEGVYRTQD
jgi:hypothetical protein